MRVRHSASRRSCQAASLIVLVLAIGQPASGHDLEKTQVSITVARDGSFVAEVANDPSWLKLRLESIPGPFADRVVFWVDGREIRPTSVEFIAGTPAINRLRGRLPSDARTLRWFYGLVIDPYPLTIRRADGRVIVEEVAGDAWSRTIDLSGQFHAPLVREKILGILIAALLVLAVVLRFIMHRFNTKDTKDTKDTKAKFLYGVTFVSFVSFVLISPAMK
jgi:hypothetical protein